jgi:carbon monoxide dehydrogenase subunit G
MGSSGPDGISRDEARNAMKFTGTITVEAPREALFARLLDASFFASCVEGVRELQKIDCHHYTAVLETSVAYLKFRFDVAVTLVRTDEPREIKARIEGTPAGIVGRLTATSVTLLAEEGTGTRLAYEVEAVLTGKLGSLGQSVLRTKAKTMERTFAERVRTAFAAEATP